MMNQDQLLSTENASKLFILIQFFLEYFVLFVYLCQIDKLKRNRKANEHLLIFLFSVGFISFYYHYFFSFFFDQFSTEIPIICQQFFFSFRRFSMICGLKKFRKSESGRSVKGGASLEISTPYPFPVRRKDEEYETSSFHEDSD